jgi:hypothetical protein
MIPRNETEDETDQVSLAEQSTLEIIGRDPSEAGTRERNTRC